MCLSFASTGWTRRSFPRFQAAIPVFYYMVFCHMAWEGIPSRSHLHSPLNGSSQLTGRGSKSCSHPAKGRCWCAPLPSDGQSRDAVSCAAPHAVIKSAALLGSSNHGAFQATQSCQFHMSTRHLTVVKGCGWNCRVPTLGENFLGETAPAMQPRPGRTQGSHQCLQFC